MVDDAVSWELLSVNLEKLVDTLTVVDERQLTLTKFFQDAAVDELSLPVVDKLPGR